MVEPAKANAVSAPDSKDAGAGWRVNESRDEKYPYLEIRVVLIYLACAALWIIFSDQALEYLTEHEYESALLQTYKGLNFVFTTGALLYLILRKAHDRRRRAERALRESYDRFEWVTAASTDAIWDWDLLRDEFWASRGWNERFGFHPQPGEPPLESWLERIHPEDRKHVLKNFEQVQREGRRVWRNEYRFRREDGSYADVAGSGFLIVNDKGVPIRAVGGVSDISARKESERRLQSSRRQLRALGARLQSLREEERTRIARQIHDELGQMLTGLKMDLHWLGRRLEKDHEAGPLLERVMEASTLTDDMIARVQQIAAELRPGVLDSLGLVAAIRFEATRLEKRSGLTCNLFLEELAGLLPAHVQTTVFRIFQEALTNVIRHAEATTVRARLFQSEGCVVLEIGDNGKGIEPDEIEATTSLGLLGMRERAEMLGGDITFRRGAEGGTCVSLRLPMATQPSQNSDAKNPDR